MFFGYWVLFAAILVAGAYFATLFQSSIVMGILGLLLVAAILAALATIVTKLGDLEEKIDKLLNEKKDEHED